MAQPKVRDDYTTYLSRPATALQARFPEWIKNKVGYDPTTAKSKAEAFAEGVRLATALRMPFQASPENRAANIEEAAARAAESKREVAKEKLKKAIKAQKTAEVVEDEEPKAAPKPKKAAKAKAPVVEETPAPAPAAKKKKKVVAAEEAAPPAKPKKVKKLRPAGDDDVAPF